MKKVLVFLLIMALFMSSMPCVAFADSNFDAYSRKEDDVVTVTDPFCEEENTVEELYADNSKLVMAMVEAWYNLIEFEERSGKTAKDT